jgi:L-2,4-diaminobutyrate transaminase
MPATTPPVTFESELTAPGLREPGLQETDRASVLHPSTSIADFAAGKIPSTIVDTASGVRIRDTEGREFIDAFSGLYCVNIGYGRTEVADAIARQAHQLAYYHTYAGHSTEELIRLSDRLLKMAPVSNGATPGAAGKMKRVFYGTSGSDANETNAKLVWYYHNLIGKPRKKRIIARERAYHGNTVMAGSMTGLNFYHNFMDLPVPAILRTGAPHHYWGAQPLEAGDETEAQFSQRRARELEALIIREDPETSAPSLENPSSAPAASFRHPQDIGRPSRPSCANTTSCSSPMKSSPASAAPVACSVQICMTSSLTSSPSRKASPRPTLP